MILHLQVFLPVLGEMFVKVMFRRLKYCRLKVSSNTKKMITFNRPDYLNDFEISNFQGTKKKKFRKRKRIIAIKYLWKTAFKKFELTTVSLQIFQRLPSTNFTWSILERFVSCVDDLCVNLIFLKRLTLSVFISADIPKQ